MCPGGRPNRPKSEKMHTKIHAFSACETNTNAQKKLKHASPGGMRGPIRRPPGAACWTCAAKELASSSSSLQALVFIFKSSCLQLFASISLFNFLHCFRLSWKAFSPLHNPPHRLAHSAVPITPDLFFMFFCVFLPSMFLPFFRLAFFVIFDDFEAAWGFQNQAKIGQMLLRKRFFGWILCLC